MSKAAAHDASCIFCKIIKGEIPSFKLLETAHAYSFLDIQPTAPGHTLIIPKYHGAKLTDIPDEYLADVLPMTKKLAKILDLDVAGQAGVGYNLLQNNGKIAHQEVPHVHFHLIPKRDEKSGLIVGWPAAETPDFEGLGKLHKELVAKLEAASEQ